MPGRAASAAWFRDDGFPAGFQVLRLSCNDCREAGGRWCTLAHVDGTQRCPARNEVKLLGKGPGAGRTALDGQARAARCAAPQPGHNEEDR